MSRRKHILFLTDEAVHALALIGHGRRWEVSARATREYPLPNSQVTTTTFTELAEAIAEAARELGECEAAVLVFPMHWCFVQVLETSHRKSQETLGYDLEPHLPMPLEEVTCAFLPVPGGRVLGVAVPTEPARQLLTALTEMEIEVHALTVDALAWLESVQNGRPEETTAVILDQRWARVISTSAKARACTALVNRETLSTNGSLLDLAAQRMGQPELNSESCSIIDIASRSVDALPSWPSGEIALEKLGHAAAASQLDLRIGALSGATARRDTTRLAKTCLVLLIACLCVLTGGFWLHERTYRQQLQIVHQRQLESYQLVYPDASLASGAAARLASERLRLEGLTRVDKRQQGNQSDPAALPLLREAVAAMPADVRVMLSDLRIDGSQLLLHGKTREHRDAERLAEALGTVQGIRPKPPRTGRVADGTVEFSISAELGHEP